MQQKGGDGLRTREEDQNGPGELVPITIVSGGFSCFSCRTEHRGEKLEPVCVSPAQESFEESEENVGDTRHAEKQTLTEQNSQICPDSMKHSSQHVGESGEDTLMLMVINEG